MSYYKISLSVKQGMTRQQPPSLFPSSSFLATQLLQHLLALTLPPRMKVVVPFPFHQKVQKSRLLWTSVSRRQSLDREDEGQSLEQCIELKGNRPYQSLSIQHQHQPQQHWGFAPDFQEKGPSYVFELGSKTLSSLSHISVIGRLLGLCLFSIFALKLFLLAFNLLIGQGQPCFALLQRRPQLFNLPFKPS